MAPGVQEQAQWFFWALGLGSCWAVAYRFVRSLEHRAKGWTIPGDIVFLLAAAYSLLCYSLGISHGRMDVFQLLGIFLGWALMETVAGRILRTIFDRFWGFMALCVLSLIHI